ncbi:MAG: hypothetical protein ABW186_09380 [Rhodanobacteraceae bacterium]
MVRRFTAKDDFAGAAKAPASSARRRPQLHRTGQRRSFVIPADAGIHFALARRSRWIPAFAGMTDLWASPE